MKRAHNPTTTIPVRHVQPAVEDVLSIVPYGITKKIKKLRKPSGKKHLAAM